MNCSSFFNKSSRMLCPKPFVRPSINRKLLIVEMGRRADKVALRKNKGNALKAKVYGKMGKKIIQVVKAGGADPARNSRLAELLKQARELGVPKDVVERNMKRASDKSQADYTELTLEAYGPAGTGFIVECLTDNLNRTLSDVKSAINKSGCKVAEAGSVAFSFQRAGQIVVGPAEEDALFEAAMEAGADDIEPLTDEEGAPNAQFKVFTAADQFGSTLSALTTNGLTVNMEESYIVFKPTTTIEVVDDDFNKCESLIERLLDLDDVDAVYTNVAGLEV